LHLLFRSYVFLPCLQDWDEKNIQNKMHKFFNYMSPTQKESWETWFEKERNLSSTCNKPVANDFFHTTTSTSSSVLSETSTTSTAGQSNFQDYVPHHLPPLHRFGVTSVPELLRAVAPDFPEFTTSQSRITSSQPSTSGRPVSLQPATYTGRKPSGALEGEKDFSDLGKDDMMLWLRDDDGKSNEYPFWMSKVLEINHSSNTVRVRWYDKVPLRTSRQSRGEAEQYANWEESKWQPWWNTYTEEESGKANHNKKRRRHTKGRPYKMAEDTMELSTGLVFFYGFQLTSDNRISKATAKRIKFQLARETASQLQQEE